MPDTYTPDKLFAGDYPMVTDVVIIKQGEVRARGTCLGKITATGKHVIVNSANADGSQNPQCILGEDVDATAGDVQAVVYLSGSFNQGAIVFGGADTAATHRAGLRAVNIYLKSAVA